MARPGRTLVTVILLTTTVAAQASDPWPRGKELGPFVRKLVSASEDADARALEVFLDALLAMDADEAGKRAGAFRFLADVLAETSNDQHLHGFDSFVGRCERAATDSDLVVRRHAFRAIAEIGYDARSLAKLVARAFEKPENATIRTEIALAAGSIHSEDPAMIPCLRFCLRHESRELRRAGALGARSLGRKAGPLAAMLGDCLHSGDGRLEEFALTALRGMGPRAAPAVPRLRALLAKGSSWKLWAIDALRAIGPGARDALPDIVRHVDTDPADVLEAALAIAPEDPITVALAKQALGPLREHLQEYDVEEFHRLGKAGKPLVPDAYAALHWAPTPLARALRAWGESKEDVIRALGRFITEPLPGWHAVMAMQAIDPEGTLALPHIIRRLQNPPRLEIESRAALALGSYGKRFASRSVPVLTRVLRHAMETDDERLVIPTLTALCAIGTPARGALPAVFEARKKYASARDRFIHVRISWTMVRLAPDSKDVQRDLIRALDAKDDQTRYFLFEPITALHHIDPAIVLPAVLRILGDERSGWSPWNLAARVLAQHRIRTPEAVRAVLRHLDAGWAEGVNEVIHALDRLVPEIPESTATLIKRLDDPAPTRPVLYAIYALGRKAHDGDREALAALDRLRQRAIAKTNPTSSLLAGVRRRLNPLIIDPSVLSQAQMPLVIEVDPDIETQGCWWDDDGLPRPTPRLDLLPDGSHHMLLTTAPGLDGTTLNLFLSRDEKGRPRIHARMGFWTCVMPEDPTYRIRGKVTLDSGDWNDASRIRGRFEIEGTRTSAASGETGTTHMSGGFDVPNPFKR